MAIIRIDVADAISSNPIALQQVVDQIIDQLDDFSTGGTGGGGGGNGDIYTLSATDGDGQVTVNLDAQTGADSAVILRAGNGMIINESGGTITFNASDGPDDGNYVTVNTATGEIQAGSTTFQYLYRYLHIGFATDENGSDFSIDPNEIPVAGEDFFIGVYNSSSVIPPEAPGDYFYREFDWSTDHNVFLRTVGGHQIEFLTSLQAFIPDASAYDPSMTPLDFDILQINNGNISDGAVTVEKLSIEQLSAITADVGVLTAGVLRGGNLTGPDPANNAPGAFGSYLSLTNGDILFGDEASYLRYDATDDEVSIIGGLATTNQMEYVLDPGATNERIMVNSNTFSNETNTSNSHYAADGLISTPTGSFFVGHAETPINDSTRALDVVNSTGIQIATRQLSENFTTSAVSTLGTVNFNNGIEDGGRVVWADFIETLVSTNNANIVASQYENRGLSNTGNSVILGTDGAARITANYPGGSPLEFTQFSTGKEGSVTGQAVISNTQNLDLPAGSYAISIEELAATRRQAIYNLSGTVGQVTGDTFNAVDVGTGSLFLNGSFVRGDTPVDNVTEATSRSFVRFRFDTQDDIYKFLYLVTADEFFNRPITKFGMTSLDVDSSRKLNMNVGSNDIGSLVVDGVRRIEVSPSDENGVSRLDIILFDENNSSGSADSFNLNLPNGPGGTPNNPEFTAALTTSYDRGLPSGVTLDMAISGQPVDIIDTVFSFIAPIRFNENITTNDELLTKFETEFDRITSLVNNANFNIGGNIQNFEGQEVRFDSDNVQVIVTNNPGSGESDLLDSNAGTSGNFAALGTVFAETNVNAHKFGIDPTTSNSVYGGWMQGNRLFTDTNITGDDIYNVAVNGIYDQAQGNFDLYGSRQFDAIPDNVSNNTEFNIVPTNNSNTEFVRSNYMLSDTSSQPQSGLMIVSSVGPMSLTGEFYGDSTGNADTNRHDLLDGAGIVMQYKEII